MAASRNWVRLAESVRERRAELGMTQEDVRQAGGPSVATMRLIEGALQESYHLSTLRDLEKALRWEPGSARRVLGGADPEPAGAPRLPVPAGSPHLDGRTRGFTVAQVTAASRLVPDMQERIGALAAEGNHDPSGPEMFPGDAAAAAAWTSARLQGSSLEEALWVTAVAMVIVRGVLEGRREGAAGTG